jgi:hypothetical protein
VLAYEKMGRHIELGDRSASHTAKPSSALRAGRPARLLERCLYQWV